jgi:hypothetical protein
MPVLLKKGALLSSPVISEGGAVPTQQIHSIGFQPTMTEDKGLLVSNDGNRQLNIVASSK